MQITCFLHHPADLSRRSGMFPLAEALGAHTVFYGATWWRLEQRSFRLGRWARTWGQRVYGSEWNSLLPGWDEQRLARAVPERQDIAHFLWGEFAAPLRPARFRRKAARIVATFHASATRLPVVLGASRVLRGLDGITLMSETQRPFFEEHGIPPERIYTILHGVDSRWYCPGANRPEPRPGEPLRGFMIGVTERDHAFLAEVMRALPRGVLHLQVATSSAQQAHYRGVEGVEILPRLTDEELREVYRAADVLVMPVMDCTANNSILESMACGTPVLVNRIGGVSEYVPASCNRLLEDKSIDRWVDALVSLQRDPAPLKAWRPQVRAWAESLDWRVVATRYIDFYQRLL